MNTRALFLAVSVAFAVTAASAQPESLGVRTGPFPKTKDGVHLEMVFNGNLTDLNEETGVVDQVWGSASPSQPPGMYNAIYIPFSVDDGFSVNGSTHDVNWYEQNHPDWLEYECDRTTLAFQFGDTGRAPLNFADPVVRAYQWANWIDAALAAGYQSVAVDEISIFNDFHRCGHFDGAHQWVPQYTGDATDTDYRRDVMKWQALTYKHIHKQSSTATMQLNLPYDPRASMDDNHQMMTTTDLLFDERGFTNFGTSGANVPTPQDWQTILDYLQYVQSQGVCYMTNGEEPEDNEHMTPEEKQWVIGNYLLVRDNCTYMYMTGRQTGYGYLVNFPEYSKPFGRPKGPMKKMGKVWERQYSNGLTIVNPYDVTAHVKLPRGQWIDVNGAAVGPRVTLTHQTALLLLKSP